MSWPPHSGTPSLLCFLHMLFSTLDPVSTAMQSSLQHSITFRNSSLRFGRHGKKTAALCFTALPVSLMWGVTLPRRFTQKYRAATNAHLGATTMTRCPRLARAMGRDPMTSPRPPVLLQGATSADTNTMSMGLLVWEWPSPPAAADDLDPFPCTVDAPQIYDAPLLCQRLVSTPFAQPRPHVPPCPVPHPPQDRLLSLDVRW
jgi:hypothetical protein